MSGGTAGTVALPGFASAPTPTTQQQNVPAEAALSPEEATILQKAYMVKYAQQIKNGEMPGIPGSNPLDEVGNTPGQPAKQTTPTLPLPPGAARPFTY